MRNSRLFLVLVPSAAALLSAGGFFAACSDDDAAGPAPVDGGGSDTSLADGGKTTDEASTDSGPQPLVVCDKEPCAVRLAGGSDHACALMSDKTVRCWGANYYRQSGQANGDTVLAPVAVPGLANVKEVTAGWTHTCALTEAGDVTCWGESEEGALSDPTDGGPQSAQIAVKLPSKATHIVAGGFHQCAELDTGAIYCWGQNNVGQSGAPAGLDAGLGKVLTPTLTPLVPGAEWDVGARFACSRFTDGGMSCFGSNFSGELGRGIDAGQLAYDEKTGPVVGLPSSTVAKLGRSRAYGEAIVLDGKVYSWGVNEVGEALPTSQAKAIITPALIQGITDATEVGVGNFFACALHKTGTVSCWGHSQHSVTGLSQDAGAYTPPSPITGTENSVQLAVGWAEFACVLKKNGTVACWGSNLVGELGRGETATATPISPIAKPVVF